MRAVLFAPHSDDETLFAAWLIIRHRPIVFVVADDPDPLVASTRRQETVRALCCLQPDLSVHFSGLIEGQFDLHDVGREMRKIHGATQVFAPAVEEGGHAEHNMVGQQAVAVWGEGMTTRYSTYTRSGGRTRMGAEVPYRSAWIALKLKALSCYRSQHEIPARAPWFTSMIDLREWVMSQCKTCGAEIRWETTKAGKKIPLDMEPAPLGNLFINEGGVVVTWDEDVGRSVPRFYSHFYTCPDAAEHRR